jgi:hypothetical protein
MNDQDVRREAARKLRHECEEMARHLGCLELRPTDSHSLRAFSDQVDGNAKLILGTRDLVRRVLHPDEYVD